MPRLNAREANQAHRRRSEKILRRELLAIFDGAAKLPNTDTGQKGSVAYSVQLLIATSSCIPAKKEERKAGDCNNVALFFFFRLNRRKHRTLM